MLILKKAAPIVSLKFSVFIKLPALYLSVLQTLCYLQIKLFFRSFSSKLYCCPIFYPFLVQLFVRIPGCSTLAEYSPKPWISNIFTNLKLQSKQLDVWTLIWKPIFYEILHVLGNWCWFSPFGFQPLSSIQHHFTANHYFSVNHCRLLLQFAFLKFYMIF